MQFKPTIRQRAMLSISEPGTVWSLDELLFSVDLGSRALPSEA